MMKRSVLAAAGALMTLLLAACSAPTTEPAPTPTTTTAPAAEPVEIPDTPVGQVTQWILDEMNREADTKAADWESRLTKEFLAEVSAADIAGLINKQIRPARPLVPTAYQGTENEAVTTVAGALGAPFDLSVALDDRGRIAGLFVKPAAPPRTPATTIGEVSDRLGDLPGDTRALITLDGKTILERDRDAAAPLGSMFKLYVLGAVADAVAAGELAWDTELTVTDAVRSLPSGELQDAADGTRVTVREAATKMISISDNTATDMLIQAVGRDAVEQAVVDMGHHAPEEMRPFLTTRELFILAYGDDEALRSRWAQGDEKARRAVLKEVAALPLEVEANEVAEHVRWPDDLEWFASAADIAKAHEQLRERSAEDDVVGEVLTKNPGLSLDTAQWPSIAFKGGSDSGVLAGSWHAERADGSVLNVIVMSSDDEAITPQSQNELFGLVQDLFTLLAE